ncbi:MAG: hypothetical protein CMF74_04585 [Maricaulis sp.]|jgi:glutathione S-transferase|nr:hypothetical protein [Maricaulis sp.]HAQ36824.1 hypothetical protein [Alphaproteobacteria bacterium]
MRHYRLISSPESIASAKMRLYLRWRNIPVRETTANRLVLKSEVVPRLKRVDIPVLITPSNETIQDSREMIDFLERREPGDRLVPEAPKEKFASRLIELFADDWLAPVTSYAIWTGEDSRAAVSLAGMLYPEHGEKELARVARMLDAQVRAKLGRQGLIEKTWTTQATRLTEFVALLDKHLSCHPYLLGAKPSVADCAVAAGLIALWSESRFGAELSAKVPAVTAWVHHINGGGTGVLRPMAKSDTDTLPGLLRFMAEQVLPHALGATEAAADWADSHPGRINLPRSIGSSSGKRDPMGVSRDFTPSTAWLLQRVLETLDVEGAKRSAAFNALLRDSGCEMLTRYSPRRELRHEHHRFRVNIDTKSMENPVNIHELAEPLLRARKASVETRDLERLVLS